MNEWMTWKEIRLVDEHGHEHLTDRTERRGTDELELRGH